MVVLQYDDNFHVFQPFLNVFCTLSLFDLLCGSRPRPRRPRAHPIAVRRHDVSGHHDDAHDDSGVIPPPSLDSLLRLSMILASPPLSLISS